MAALDEMATDPSIDAHGREENAECCRVDSASSHPSAQWKEVMFPRVVSYWFVQALDHAPFAVAVDHGYRSVQQRAVSC